MITLSRALEKMSATLPHGGMAASYALLLNGEIAAVLAAMRASDRWSSPGRYAVRRPLISCRALSVPPAPALTPPAPPEQEEEAEDALVESLKELRRSVFTWRGALPPPCAAAAFATPRVLTQCKFTTPADWSRVDPLRWLAPLLSVVRSPDTSGAVTDAALAALLRALRGGLLRAGPPGALPVAAAALAEGVTQAKFEAGRPGADEVVLARVLDVLAALAAGPEGPALPHDALLAAFQAMYRIGHYRTQRGRETSELLTQAARRAMGEVVEAVFARVGAGGLGGARGGGGAASPALAHAARLRVGGGGRGSAGGSAVGSPTHAAGGDANGAAAAAEGAPPVPPLPSPLPAPLEIVSLPDDDDDSASDGAGAATPPRPPPVAAPRGAAAGYGEDAARELLLFLVALVGAPAPRSAAAAAPPPGLPALGLRLAAAALAAAGPALGGRPALLAVLQEDLVRAMFAAGASDGAGGPPSLAALSGVCQLALSLYLHLGAPLLLQLEALLALLLLPLAEGAPGTAAEGRPPLQQAALEGVLAFAAQPRFAVDAFLNADCRVERANLFERLCALLSKAAFPVGGPLGPVHTLALDGVVAVLGALDDAAAGEDGGDSEGGADGGDGSAAGGSDAGSEDEAEDFSGEPAAFVDIWTPLCAGEVPPAALALGAAAATPGAAARAERALKARLAAAAERFNEDPRKGLAHLTALKLLPAEPDAGAVARCLRACPGLEKAAIGEVLGERDEFHDAVRAAFGATFDFAGLPFDAALRLFMDSFRPPGEGQKIDRIMQVCILRVVCVLWWFSIHYSFNYYWFIASVYRAIFALVLSSLRHPLTSSTRPPTLPPHSSSARATTLPRARPRASPRLTPHTCSPSPWSCSTRTCTTRRTSAR